MEFGPFSAVSLKDSIADLYGRMVLKSTSIDWDKSPNIWPAGNATNTELSERIWIRFIYKRKNLIIFFYKTGLCFNSFIN